MMSRALSLGALLLVAACGGEEEEPIAIDAVPAPVITAVRQRFPNASVTAAAREREAGKTLYEVSLQDGTRKIDVTATPEGALVAIEGALSERDLPAAVRRSISEKYPGSTHRIIEDVLTKERGAEQLAYYEVLLELADKRFLEVQIAPDGRILKEEKKSAVEP